MKFNRIVSSIAITGVLVSSGLAWAGSGALSNAQQQQVKQIVHDYVSQNPEVIIQALQGYQQKQMAQSVEKTQTTSRENIGDIFRSASDPIAGNPKGKVTVVEFFDYQCAHCVGMQSVFQSLLKNNPDVKVVFKEFPIRGPVSELAAKAALAAAMQGKYIPLHDALMQAAAKGPLTEDIIYKAAADAGVDVAKLKTDMQSEAIAKQIKANYALAQRLELMGTPAIFVAASNISKSSPASAIVFIPGETDTAHLNDVINQVGK